MNTKRILYILTVCVLLAAIGTLPSAPAEGGGSCDHQWVLQDSVPPGCTETGLELYGCSLCGAQKTEEIPALGHDWYICTVVTAATCTEDGLIRCFCSRDETHYEDKVLPALGHNWGEWVLLRAATLSTPGLAERQCQRCQATEQLWIPAQIQRRDYELKAVMVPAPDSPESLPADCFAENPECRLTFDCAVINTGKKDLFVRSYRLNGGSEPESLEEPLFLPAGQLIVFSLERTVTQADILPDPEDGAGGLIQSEYCFYGETETGETACLSDPVLLTSRIRREPDASPPGPVAMLRVVQEIVSEPADAAGYRPDEVIQYTVTVINRSEQAVDRLLLTETESGETLSLSGLQAGETQVLTLEYRVVPQDAVNGYVCRSLLLQEDGNEENAVRSNLLIVPVQAE